MKIISFLHLSLFELYYLFIKIYSEAQKNKIIDPKLYPLITFCQNFFGRVLFFFVIF